MGQRIFAYGLLRSNPDAFRSVAPSSGKAARVLRDGLGNCSGLPTGLQQLADGKIDLDEGFKSFRHLKNELCRQMKDGHVTGR
jgi:hypothetical protein